MAVARVLPDLAYERSCNAHTVELGDEERYPFPVDLSTMISVRCCSVWMIPPRESTSPSGRPTVRGKGLGNVLMALTIQEARKCGTRELHVHCHTDDEASARKIISNGGTLVAEIEHGETARIVQRFVIAAS